MVIAPAVANGAAAAMPQGDIRASTDARNRKSAISLIRND